MIDAMKKLKNLNYKLGLVIILCICSYSYLYGQKHTFTNNEGTFVDYNTGESTTTKDIDNITIENMGGEQFKFSDEKESILYRYSHIENSMYVYKKVGGKSTLKCIQKLSSFAEGKPGKIILEIEGATFELRYELDN